MTTEKQAPEALAAECKRLVIEFGKATVRVSVNISKENIEGITVAQNELHAAIDRLAALASAQAQQPDPMLRHLIYSAIVHLGRLKTLADHEAAADRVFDMLVRGNHIASAQAQRAAQPAEPADMFEALPAGRDHSPGCNISCGMPAQGCSCGIADDMDRATKKDKP